jgi:poly(A)-specific ribonuclease
LFEEALHEAGYDSYITARIMILLSAKLEAAGSYIPSPSIISDDDDYLTAPESGTPESYSKAATGGVSLTTNSEAPKQTLLTSPISKQKQKTKRKPFQSSPSTSSRSRFASQTPFEALDALTLEENADTRAHMNGAPLPGSAADVNPAQRSIAPSRSRVFTPGGTLNPDAHSSNQKKDADMLMPPFESDFWRVYANKLRIFGTEERLLDLDPTCRG